MRVQNVIWLKGSSILWMATKQNSKVFMASCKVIRGKSKDIIIGNVLLLALCETILLANVPVDLQGNEGVVCSFCLNSWHTQLILESVTRETSTIIRFISIAYHQGLYQFTSHISSDNCI